MDEPSARIDLSELKSERVFVEELLIVLPSEHPTIRHAADLKVSTLAALEPGCTYRNLAEQWTRACKTISTVELSSYHAILASVSAGNAVGVMPRSVLDLMQRPFNVKTHSLGTVDTLLIRRKNDHSAIFTSFHQELTSAQSSKKAAARV